MRRSPTHCCGVSVVELVIYPDSTELARAMLLQELPSQGITGVPVGSKAIGGKPMPSRYIRVYAIPGREVCLRTQWCQIVAKTYDTDEERCADTAMKVAAILRAAPEIVINGDQKVSEPCELHGPFPTSDPDVPNYSVYQANLTWTLQSTVTP